MTIEMMKYCLVALMSMLCIALSFFLFPNISTLDIWKGDMNFGNGQTTAGLSDASIWQCADYYLLKCIVLLIMLRGTLWGAGVSHSIIWASGGICSCVDGDVVFSSPRYKRPLKSSPIYYIPPEVSHVCTHFLDSVGRRCSIRVVRILPLLLPH